MATHTEQTDYEEILQARAAGRDVNPAVKQRVLERAENARQEMLRRFGLQNIGTDIIRERRDAQSAG